MRRRPVVMRRPATANNRRRRLLGPQVRAGWSCRQLSGPSEQFGSQLDEFEPNLVLGECLPAGSSVGVLEPADAVVGACPESVADF